MKPRYKILIGMALAIFAWYWLSGELYVWGI